MPPSVKDGSARCSTVNPQGTGRVRVNLHGGSAWPSDVFEHRSNLPNDHVRRGDTGCALLRDELVATTAWPEYALTPAWHGRIKTRWC
jgi:hypothetical protein